MTIFELVIYLVVIIGVLFLCYYASKTIAKKMGGGVTSVSGSNIKVVERVALGQDKYLVICKVCGSYYLIGVSNQSIKILAQLSEEHFNTEKQPAQNNFFEVLMKAAKRDRNQTK